jgi:peroxiredoxin
MMLRPLLLASALTAGCLAGCNGASTSAPTAEPSHAATGAGAPGEGSAMQAAQAEVGKTAPDFTLNDYDGKTVHLADLRGKTVVLEWFNPDCPFVKASHTKGSLKGLAKRWTDKGVVWLAVDSSAPGKQGNPPERVAAGKKAFEMDHPILADETGKVGKLYGATNTPHMFVIDPQGVLAYRGAIDNSPDGEAESPTGGTLVSYVDVALQAVTTGKPVATKDTKAYGCGVKYASH